MTDPAFLRAHPVLFVDDEPDNLLVLRHTFSKRYDVLTAPDALAALRLLEERPVAVLVTDQRMPGMSGVTLCAEVRSRWPATRRIVLTAWGDRDAAVTAINEGGVHAFIDKPWQVEELDGLLRDAVAEAALQLREAELRRTLLERERLLALDAIRQRVAHDLGNAAGIADLGFDALQEIFERNRSNFEAFEQQDGVEAMRVLRQALDLISGLHSELRLLPGKLQRKPELVRLSETLTLITRMFPAEDAARLDISADTALTAWVDRLHLSRILMNLIYNSLHALRAADTPQGRVRVQCRQGDDGRVQVTVLDDGPGVPESLRARVFDEGFSTRADSPGLGLAIARELAMGEGGALTLAAPVTGEGARFLLTVPRERPPTG